MRKGMMVLLAVVALSGASLMAVSNQQRERPVLRRL